jgi:hypothetical protein
MANKAKYKTSSRSEMNEMKMDKAMEHMEAKKMQNTMKQKMKSGRKK